MTGKVVSAGNGGGQLIPAEFYSSYTPLGFLAGVLKSAAGRIGSLTAGNLLWRAIDSQVLKTPTSNAGLVLTVTNVIAQFYAMEQLWSQLSIKNRVIATLTGTFLAWRLWKSVASIGAPAVSISNQPPVVHITTPPPQIFYVTGGGGQLFSQMPASSSVSDALENRNLFRLGRKTQELSQ